MSEVLDWQKWKNQTRNIADNLELIKKDIFKRGCVLKSELDNKQVHYVEHK